MLFFSRFKQGKYGHFYGSVDPMLIMSSLQDFLRERNDAIFDMESERNLKREQETRKNAMTRKEYLEWKEKNNHINKISNDKTRISKIGRKKHRY